MVRKIAWCLFAGLLLLAVPAQASAHSVYTDGNISSTYTVIFEDVINKLGSTDDYVFFRSGQYEYTLIAGDLNYENGSFTASEYKEYTLSYSSGSYSQSAYSFSSSSGTNFSLSSGSLLVYSSLGPYPDLIERGSVYEFTTLHLLAVIGLCCLVRPVFAFVQRNSNGS